MDQVWTYMVLPYVLVLARVSGFMIIAPIFSLSIVPAVVRISLALLLAVSFAGLVPGGNTMPPQNWVAAIVILGKEITIGFSIGLAGRLVYQAVQQAGVMLAQQMGLTDAEVIDPVGGEESESIATLLEMTFAVLFLVAGGHQLLLSSLMGSYKVFHVAGNLDVGMMANAIVSAGSTMMLLAMKLAAPAMAAFFVLSIVLAFLARILPDMNILFESYPLRMGLGVGIAAAMLPSLNNFTDEFALWLHTAFT